MNIYIFFKFGKIILMCIMKIFISVFDNVLDKCIGIKYEQVKVSYKYYIKRIMFKIYDLWSLLLDLYKFARMFMWCIVMH